VLTVVLAYLAALLLVVLRSCVILECLHQPGSSTYVEIKYSKLLIYNPHLGHFLKPWQLQTVLEMCFLNLQNQETSLKAHLIDRHTQQ